MWHIYRTLTSDVTNDYSGNVANKFKVKLGLTLPGEGWKVSIISAILPKMALFKDLKTSNVNLMSLFGKTEKNGASDQWIQGAFKSSDLQTWEKSHMCTTAEEFFNCVMHRLDETAHANLDSGFKFSTEWTRLAWDKNGAQPEMIISTASSQNLLYVQKTFSNALGWTKADDSGTMSLGKNMVPGYATYAKGTSSLSNGKVFTLYAGQYVQLNALSDWRFINLKQSFNEALNLHSRPLTVTAKVTSATAKKTVTFDQPMSHVYYAPQGRERHVFSPPVEEFHPIYTRDWYEVEISLQELDGSLVNFQPDSQCVVRLHFQQD